MNKKALKTLEYNKIIALLEQCAGSTQGKAYCRELLPVSNLSQIKRMQAETKDALSRIFKRGSVSFSGITDVRPFLKHLEIGSSLTISELLAITSLLEVAKRVKTYGRSENDLSIESDHLAHFFNNLEPLTPVCQEIRHCILSEDSIADDASPGLKNIRRQKNVIGERIRTQMNTMLNNNTTRSYLQDGVITVRGGRYCLPVKAEYKNYVPGMVHDQSSSGSTLFIEPMSVVNLNNSLRELELQEAEEIEKILADLSNLVAEHTEEISQDFMILAELDFIFAKGELARKMNAVEPEFHTDGIIHLRAARHPLLDPKHVVPIDLTLGKDYNLLIVTGPNTGGKTVSLKTCGLLSLMGQAGLHIPTKDRSQLSIFDDVFADIGDEQSIEQSLSTFSSHMTNIVHILREVERSSGHYLCLFDELCAGTDPKEGAALATAILSSLHERGVLTMATTHYSELKMYALSTPGVENACCEFSVETLSPTYHLLIGIPGKSNAFAISKKLGLSDDLIADAKTHVTEDDQNFEDLMVDLEQRRVSMMRDSEEIARQKREMEDLQKKLKEREDRLNASKDKILRQANEDASHILQEAKQIADETIRDFNKYSHSNPDIAKMEAKRAAVGKKLAASRKKASVAAKDNNKPKNHKVPKNLRVGDPVKVLSMNINGTVYSLPNARGDLQVQMGIMRSKVNINDLILLEDNDTAAKTTGKKSRYTGNGGFSKAATISPEINLLGLNGDEAVAKLDKYLDDAYVSHLKSVRVVHGKGTGALRKAVHQYLRKQKIVDEFHLAEFGEGDAGVTIVTFK
ncbi:endonuclease MutS2 [Roseburia sp. NSJ-9]|uniref:Endonuclease MutS2 n=1 Tax=Roseburia lenta TaxID=2763061 RepID=A0ABR7GEX8_9FIRM|nr:endonuclease MutS2 [Roseburia lenta]MBC5686003.1 endonuclease MutS2 [Roseburia lenta]